MGIVSGDSAKPKPRTSNGKSSPSSRATFEELIKLEDAPTSYDQRGGAIIEIWGPTGSGRTTLALTAPGPILYLGFLEKARGIIEPFAREKPIKWKIVGGVFRSDNPDDAQNSKEIREQATPYADAFEYLFHNAFGEFRTVIVDTHPAAWELLRLAEFGAPKPAKGRIEREWASINNRWRSIIRKARTQNYTSVIFIGESEEEWREDEKGFSKKTGRLLRQSSSASNALLLTADLSLKTDKTVSGSGGFLSGQAGRKVSFSVEIFKGWGRAQELEGEVHEDPFCNIPFILGRATDTDPKEWE